MSPDYFQLYLSLTNGAAKYMALSAKVKKQSVTFYQRATMWKKFKDVWFEVDKSELILVLTFYCL